jgi:hypothetical protein
MYVYKYEIRIKNETSFCKILESRKVPDVIQPKHVPLMLIMLYFFYWKTDNWKVHSLGKLFVGVNTILFFIGNIG